MKNSWSAVFARVRYALMKRGRSSEEADDFVQEAWLRLADVQKDRSVEEPAPYLMRIALNLSIDAHRSDSRRGEEVQLLDDFVILETAPSVEATLLARERIDRLTVCLGRLNVKTRDIFLDHRLDGLTYSAIAQSRGLSVTTVEWHVARALTLITNWMEGW